ncbi:MAG: A/G-specific adenine glycosylase [Rhodoplanes sp.]|uniref:A/G-specific adenine glycosylase n=1 Tax=Rhodoplanes sp. TaxID=1968906 RepID=UPI00185C6528|nr:A/G-specific adenine glycosylase [Rhodoplanes sp.]NVO15905.1 A/G-specific adenine glycosylase [Rhodoplanes sp.]
MTVAAPPPGRKTSRAARAAEPSPGALAAALLGWYDRHRRVLPWRAPPGVKADPYAVWLSEIMLQQTTVKAVVPYFQKFTAAFPTVRDLAEAELDSVLRLWAGLGYYARARNLHACAKVLVDRYGGVFPRSVEELRALPGIGAYTANAVASIAFDLPVVPIDGNVERVLTRVHAVEEMLPAAKPRVTALAEALEPSDRPGDFAQALMDLGATICTPKAPACVLCPWAEPCLARRRGDPETFPVKAPKREGLLRRGAAFVAVRADGAVLVRTRVAEGLLGGMTEVPTGAWSGDHDEATSLDHAPDLGVARRQWRRVPGVVTHVFTHFPLELLVFVADVADRIAAPGGMRWIARKDLAGEAFPSLMRKVIAHAGIDLRPGEAPSGDAPAHAQKPDPTKTNRRRR